MTAVGWARFSADPSAVELEPGTAKAVLSGEITGKGELLRALASDLSFPSYSGKNWDALEEALLDMLPNQGRRIMIVHTELPLLSEDDLNVYLRVLAGAASERLRRREPPIEAVFPVEAKRLVNKLLHRP